jgi:hypothetical protein
MLFFIAIDGGLQIMMGQHARSESLFYYFRIEDQVCTQCDATLLAFRIAADVSYL